MKDKIIQQGAEAVIILKRKKILKRRIAKGYRLEELDVGIRRRRTRSEARLLEKADKVINVPNVLKVNDSDKEIEMEFIDGVKLSEGLDGLKNWKEVCFLIGVNIGKLHDAGIIHGDLTTSNMIWVSDVGASGLVPTPPLTAEQRGEVSGEVQDKVYFIDFGLGYGNGRVEDKAVDLHLIKQALEAKHFGRWEEYWDEIQRGYLEESKGAREVLKRLEKVEKRGRYKGNY